MIDQVGTPHPHTSALVYQDEAPELFCDAPPSPNTPFI